MNNALLRLYVKMQNLMNQDEGQDLVEYALVITILSVGCVAALGTLATSVKAVFTAIEGSL